MHYFQWNIKSYRADTAHLSNGEDLAYRRLIEHYYDTEQPIPNALPVLSRRLRVAMPDIETVLGEFFFLDGDVWKHAYIEQEIEKYHSFIDRQKANGSKGGRGKKADANPNKPTALPEKASAKPTRNKQQVTSNKKQNLKPSCASSEGANGKSVYSTAFLAFYELYPRKKSKGDAAKAFKKVNPAEYPAVKAGLMAAIASDDWKRDPQFIPYPASWLNARGWEDDHEGNAKLGGGSQKPWFIVWPQIVTKGAEKGLVETKDLFGPHLKIAIFKAYGITSEMEARAIAEWKDRK